MPKECDRFSVERVAMAKTPCCSITVSWVDQIEDCPVTYDCDAVQACVSCSYIQACISLSGPEIVEAINSELGGTAWQGP